MRRMLFLGALAAHALPIFVVILRDLLGTVVC
jgi:hypothetical protein